MVRNGLLIGAAVLLAAGCAHRDNHASTSSSEAGGDAAQIQGTWEQQPEQGPASSPRQRVVKEVKGDTETVTTYAADGKVLHAQTARIRLSRSGKVPVYTFSDRQITAGPEAGRSDAAPRSFVYRLRGDEFDEVWGLLPGQEQREVVVKRWRRAGREAAGAVVRDGVTASPHSGHRSPANRTSYPQPGHNPRRRLHMRLATRAPALHPAGAVASNSNQYGTA